MKKKLFILLMLFLAHSLVAQVYDREEKKYPEIGGEIADAINDYYYRDNRSHWKKGRSSVLIEEGKAEDTYELSKLNDNDLSTAWVEGVKGAGIGEYVLQQIYVLNENMGWLEEFDYGNNKRVKVILKINDGFCKNEILFKKNNRVKNARITIYDAPLVVGQNNTYVEAEPILLKNVVIALTDSMNEQSFEFVIELRNDYKLDQPAVILKFTILDVYKGTSYDDTCISEMHVYGEYKDKE
jgi:hypothetical protein